MVIIFSPGLLPRPPRVSNHPYSFHARLPIEKLSLTANGPGVFAFYTGSLTSSSAAAASCLCSNYPASREQRHLP